MIVQYNAGEAIRNITLPDNSIIGLSPASSVSYDNSFNTGRRDVSLTGKALFKVAKDSTRPFTVHAGDISTTVLGTTFMMSTLERNKVHVKLFEGKVLIRFTTKKMPLQEIRLHAGEHFIIDRQLGQFTVAAFKDSIHIPGDKTITAANDTGNVVFEFKQEPLTKVLARIGSRYHVQFRFKSKVLTICWLQAGSCHPIHYRLFLPCSVISTVYLFKEHDSKIEVINQQ